MCLPIDQLQKMCSCKATLSKSMQITPNSDLPSDNFSLAHLFLCRLQDFLGSLPEGTNLFTGQPLDGEITQVRRMA